MSQSGTKSITYTQKPLLQSLKYEHRIAGLSWLQKNRHCSEYGQHMSNVIEDSKYFWIFASWIFYRILFWIANTQNQRIIRNVLAKDFVLKQCFFFLLSLRFLLFCFLVFLPFFFGPGNFLIDCPIVVILPCVDLWPYDNSLCSQHSSNAIKVHETKKKVQAGLKKMKWSGDSFSSVLLSFCFSIWAD